MAGEASVQRRAEGNTAAHPSSIGHIMSFSVKIPVFN